jgi:hypothetical protein
VIIGEYSPRRSRGECSPIIAEPEVIVFLGTEFILILLISLACSNFRKTAISILLYKYVKCDQSTYRICTSNLTNQLVGFVIFHLCENTIKLYIYINTEYVLYLLNSVVNLGIFHVRQGRISEIIF